MNYSEDFFNRAKIIHNDKYDYGKSVYKKSNVKLTIICPIHGEFLKTPSKHIEGSGCQICAKIKRISNGTRFKNQNEVFTECANLHNHKYTYLSLAQCKNEYITVNDKITINCTEHGQFIQTIDSHIYKQTGCPICGIISNANNCRKTKEQFILDSTAIHGNKYDYSNSIYLSTHSKITINCHEHGDFITAPAEHLAGVGCPACKRKQTDNQYLITYNNRFIEEASMVFNNKYDYSKVKYIAYNVHVTIICPIHGEYLKTPSQHLQGFGCEECRIEQDRLKREAVFLSQAKNIFDDMYDYSKVKYIDQSTPITITCPVHGDFEKLPSLHCRISASGCPNCYATGPEKLIIALLTKHNINYKFQQTFADCLGNPHGDDNRQRRLRFDFYLPNHNTIIEYDGIHHYKIINFEDNMIKAHLRFNTVQQNDTIKNKYCKSKAIHLLRIPYTKLPDLKDIICNHLNIVDI